MHHYCDSISNESFEYLGQHIYNNDNNIELLFMEKKKLMEKLFDMESILHNINKNLHELLIVQKELTKKNYNIDLQKTYSRSSSSFIYSALYRNISNPIRNQLTKIYVKIEDSQNYKNNVVFEIEELEKQLIIINNDIYEYCCLEYD